MRNQLMISSIVLILSQAAMSVCVAQECPGGMCPSPSGGAILAIDYTPSTRAAVRVRAGNACGSGAIVGRYKTGSLVLTNAHVVGTRVGRQVDIDVSVNGRSRTIKGRVVMAAYSDRTLTDWAVVYIADFDDIEPVKCSKAKPSGSHYTRGSPRCVWPLVTTDIQTVEVDDNSPLWRWRPNSIGGQSGSAVWSYRDHLQYGLLTWSWGGYGAGQQTSEIYRQARDRTVDGTIRPPGLRTPDRADEIVLETGFFAEADIDALPIWADEGDSGDNPDRALPPVDYALFAELKKEVELSGGKMRFVVCFVVAALMTLTASVSAAQGFERGPLRRSWSCAVKGVLAGVATYSQCAAHEGLRVRGRRLERRRCIDRCRDTYQGTRNRHSRRQCVRGCRR